MRFNLRLPSGLFALCALLPLGRAAELALTATDQTGAPVGDLIVWLTPLDAPLPPAPATPPEAEIVQQGEEFTPYTLPVRVGTRVRFPNLDDVQHHVYSLSKPKKFDIPLHGGATDESIVIDRAGIVPVGCNIHDWMLAYVVVVDTPWFATSNAQGRVQLTDLPAGRYTLEAWHPQLRGTATAEITLQDDAPATHAFSLTLRPDRRIRRAPDAAGKTY